MRWKGATKLFRTSRESESDWRTLGFLRDRFAGLLNLVLVLFFLLLFDNAFDFVFVLGIEHANTDAEDADEEL